MSSSAAELFAAIKAVKPDFEIDKHPGAKAFFEQELPPSALISPTQALDEAVFDQAYPVLELAKAAFFGGCVGTCALPKDSWWKNLAERIKSANPALAENKFKRTVMAFALRSETKQVEIDPYDNPYGIAFDEDEIPEVVNDKGLVEETVTTFDFRGADCIIIQQQLMQDEFVMLLLAAEQLKLVPQLGRKWYQDSGVWL